MNINKLVMVCLLLLPVMASASEVIISDNGLAYIGAALAVGLSSIAGGIAVGLVGAAAMAVVGEKEEMSGKALIFLGLAEGIAIYGFIIAIMILGRLG